MDFALNEQQQAVFDMAFGFGQDAIAPNADQWEQDGTIPRSFLEAAGELGLGGMLVDPDHGGSGLSRLETSLAIEGLAMACPSVSAFLSIHNMVAWMIDRFGDTALHERYLGDLCAMTKIASYCLTEPGSGSDAVAMKTRAEEVAGGFALTGSKSFISGGGFSDLYLVMARDASLLQDGAEQPAAKVISAFLLDNGTEGLSFGAPERKMGWRAQPTSQVNMDKAVLPADQRLGEAGRGFVYAMKGLDGGRVNIAAAALGAAQTALDKAVAYAGERRAFGQSLDRFQSVQFKLADMETQLQVSRVFLRQAAWKLDQGAPDATAHCAMAKRFVTDTAFAVANEALQIHGGYGYLADYGLEKIVRDLRVHQILEGTNEIMRLIVARHLLANA
jgi:alkylation response protein AidB-like acyl-CoA dehydrogenase